MNEELTRLENEGIIEDVTGEPISGLNPLLIVPKGEHNIRICVEVSAANKAIMIPYSYARRFACEAKGLQFFLQN